MIFNLIVISGISSVMLQSLHFIYTTLYFFWYGSFILCNFSFIISLLGVSTNALLQENQFQSDFSLALMNWHQHIATSTTNLVWSTIWIWFLWMKRIGGISSSKKSQSIGFLKLNYFLKFKGFKHFGMRKSAHAMAPLLKPLVWLYEGKKLVDRLSELSM